VRVSEELDGHELIEEVGGDMGLYEPSKLWRRWNSAVHVNKAGEPKPTASEDLCVRIAGVLFVADSDVRLTGVLTSLRCVGILLTNIESYA
jgi:hypothetical protein